jgi:hypothetical protein
LRVLTFLTTVALATILGFAQANKAPDSKAGTKAPPKTPATQSAAPATKSAGSKTVTSKPAAPKTSASVKSAPAKYTASSVKSSASTAASKRPVNRYQRSSQQQPTTDRYKEIQHALADKGYFAGSPDGVWGPDSVDALKRFQRDQNLTDDGKLGSLSLIALGLGPRREASAAPPAADPTTP